MVLLTDSFLMDLSILVVGVLGIFYWLATKNFGHWRKKGVPYIEPKPFVGNLQDMALGKTSMGELLAKFYLDAVGKPYIGMFAFHRPILLVRDADVIKSILVKDFNYFRDRTFSPDEKLDPMFTKNLFGLSGPRWRHIRVKLTPTFTSGKMKLMYEFVNECGKEMVQLVNRELGGGGEQYFLEIRNKVKLS
ncbi:Cytochrome P450 6j1 [Gryllus bimaculatus]|nr:Cytochrome P450 6j1 [Gryllus bimaculatus]